MWTFEGGYLHQSMHKWSQGASLVKYITPLSCIGSSESDWKIYTYFEFYEEKIMNICKTRWSTKPQYLCWQYFFQEKSIYFKDSASSVQVNILNMYLSKICLKCNKITSNRCITTNIEMLPSSI